MESFVIAVIGEKGGSGRTTLVRALASAGLARGLGVHVLDLDPDHAFTDWLEVVTARGGGAGLGERLVAEAVPDCEMALDRIAIVTGMVPDTVMSEAALPDLVLIDSRGLSGAPLRALMAEVDVLVLPVIPNETDIRVQWRSFATYRAFLEQSDDGAFPPPLAVLLSRFPARPNRHQQDARDLIDAALPVLAPVLSDRAAFVRMDSEGLLGSMLRESRRPGMRGGGAWSRHVEDALGEAIDVLQAVMDLPRLG